MLLLPCPLEQAPYNSADGSKKTLGLTWTCGVRNKRNVRGALVIWQCCFVNQQRSACISLGEQANVNANNEGFVYFPLARVGSLINDWCTCVSVCVVLESWEIWGFLSISECTCSCVALWVGSSGGVCPNFKKLIKGCNSKQSSAVFNCRVTSQMCVYWLFYNGPFT